MVKKYRKDGDVSYALGATIAMELMNRRPEYVRALYVSTKSDVTAPVARAEELGVPVIVGDKAFNILSPKENCFIIGEFQKFTTLLSGGDHVVLVNPSNAGNLGTIMRAALAFDCADIAVIRPAVDPFDPKTVRASMGAVFSARLSMYDDFSEYEREFGDREIVPFMLGGKPFSDKEFYPDKKYSLVFGNEATGLPNAFERFGGVEIEQSEMVDSLNLSVAAAIAMYECRMKKSLKK